MNNIVNLDQTCSQLALPYCRHIGKSSFYPSRNFMITEDVRVTSVSTLCLLIILIFSLIRVHMHIYKKYVAEARSELMLICDLYLFSLLFEFLLLTEMFESKILVTIQMCTINAIFSVLLWMSFFTTMCEVYNSYSKVRFFTIVHFIVSGILIGIFFKSPEIVFFNGLLNATIVFLFFFIQTCKLKIKRSELWPYGNLIIGMFFFSFGSVLFFIGNEIVSFLCNGYVDGIFIVHTMFFLSFLMLHKFWLSTCDFEIECATIS
ncbi:Chitin synthase III catalytic subunit protein [Pseudoloma neurophilia]|uniref:Chitin synthase III catalytic subunit protein n=1 Tax=Pseudoloma neurophilia TaxID=146866 RepID=A0A0R0LZK2_9MICR|nr:Chitin synthase III catalytic subunit protein [Pseudoloma neurophilia]